MHAYLLISQTLDPQTQIEELAKKLKAKTLEFSFAKINDARSLNAFTALTVNAPTAIVLKNIDEATLEAANAFLKNLEEPQENLFFILTAKTSANILPTILSRCQVIRVAGEKVKKESAEAEEFIKMKTGERLKYTENLRKRDRALEFVESLIFSLHTKLTTENDLAQISAYLKGATGAREALKQNGNVGLQLTNLVVNLASS